MKIKTNNKTKIILIFSWISVMFLGILLFRTPGIQILKEEQLDPISNFQDTENYNFSVNGNIETEYSKLYICKRDNIPEYLNEFADKIDNSLQRVESPNFVRWIKDDKEVLVYNIDSTTLNIYLEQYPEAINFSSVEQFITDYLNPDIKHSDINIEVDQDTEIYTANRLIGEDELVTGYGYSDFFYVENGYLTSARVLLAELIDTEYYVPLIKNGRAIETYLNSEYFTKDVIIFTSEIIELTPYTYEDFEPEYTYEKCVVNDINPKLYFSSCNQNYIYNAYKIEGTCDITYDGKLYAVPFSGFMNAVNPEYVKSTE
jgi:hypothetical protein